MTTIWPAFRRALDEGDEQTFAYLNKLVQYMAVTDGQAARPEKYWNRVAASKVGKRDEDVAALDVEELEPWVAALLKHLLIETDRYERALGRLSNLRALDDLLVPERPVAGCIVCAHDQH